MTTRNHRIRFMTYNQAAAPSTELTVSGALAGFPGANTLEELRYKTWIPPGTFEITSSTCKLYINDDADQTVTLTTGTYTYATLAAHVEAQLNDASSDWTCTYSTTTGKFTIARSSGTAVLRFSQTTDAAWDTLGYTGTVDDSTGPFVSDIARNHTSEWWKVDLGAALTMEAFIANAPLGALFPISEGATATLEANSVDVWTSPPLSRPLTVTNLGIVEFLDELAEAARTYRYWRFRFIDRTNPVGPEGFELAKFYLGTYFTPSIRNIRSGFEKVIGDPSERVVSDAGVRFSRLRKKKVRLDSASIEFMAAEDRRALEQVFDEVGQHTPLFVSVDPLVQVSTDSTELTRYVHFDSDLKVVHVKADICSVAFSLVEAN